MTEQERIFQIRESEKKSHTFIYSKSILFQDDNWLKKPIKTVTDLYPFFQNHSSLRVLDLGSGVGRNSIPIAMQFHDRDCIVDCVDILDLAIDKLNKYAAEFGVSHSIRGIPAPIDDFSISSNYYDWILSVSSLEHMDSSSSFQDKLLEIRRGLRIGGIVCLVINSNVQEQDRKTNFPVPAQFEVNLPTEKLLDILYNSFNGFEILKSTIREQHYEIPREWGISDLKTSVVTYVARRIK